MSEADIVRGAGGSEATTLIWGDFGGILGGVSGGILGGRPKTREIGEAKKFSKSSVKFSNFPKNRRKWGVVPSKMKPK